MRLNGPGGPAYPLIDLSLVQQCKGEQTNLVLALTAGISPYGQMPKSPPAPRHATADEVRKIVEWLKPADARVSRRHRHASPESFRTGRPADSRPSPVAINVAAGSWREALACESPSCLRPSSRT